VDQLFPYLSFVYFHLFTQNSVLHSHSSQRLYQECSDDEAVKEFLKEELNATMHHVNDVTQFVVKPSVLNGADLNQSIAVDPSNPFDDATIDKLLASLKIPISCYQNYHYVNGSLPKFCKSKPSELGMLYVVFICVVLCCKLVIYVNGN